MKTREMIEEIDEQMNKLVAYRSALEILEEIWLCIGPYSDVLTDEIMDQLRNFMKFDDSE